MANVVLITEIFLKMKQTKNENTLNNSEFIINKIISFILDGFLI